MKRIDSINELKKLVGQFLEKESVFFASMKTYEDLGKLIDLASKEESLETKAKTFLEGLED